MNIPRLPTTSDTGLGRTLLRYYTDAGLTICRGDGSHAVTFPHRQFERNPTDTSLLLFHWQDPTTETALNQEDDDEPSEPTSYLVLFDPVTGSEDVLTPPMHIVEFTWGPSGTEVWFCTGGSADRIVYRLDIKSKTVTEIAAGVSPIPAPEGQRVAFLGLDPMGVHMVEPGRKGPQYVCEGHPNCWSHDGRYLAILRVINMRWQLFVLDTASGEIVHVAPESAFSYWPTWLPDNKTIVFEKSLAGKAGPPSVLCRATVQGEPAQQLTGGPGDEQPRAHSRFGYLVYQRRDPSNKHDTRVVVADSDGKTLHELGPGLEPHWFL